MSPTQTSRRAVLTGAASVGGLMLSGCDRLSSSPSFQDFIGRAEGLSLRSQRLLLSGQPLAHEYGPAMRSPIFKANGSTSVDTPDYQRLLAGGFHDYRLRVYGLVGRPLALSLAQLKSLPTQSQTTRHDCVEGWSAIGQWTGVRLSRLLALAGVQPQARYVIFHCADNLGGASDASGLYYESLDMFDAFHPQTIMAWAMNGEPLPVAHGAPLRLRVERQLGYKSAKYVMGIELSDRMDRYGAGKGGFWEDRGYAWYAGI